jgi:D-beta-D-heptose 7-phosphate kinase/D-beta-D-heptose 1-phosphate adenosyltransferase
LGEVSNAYLHLEIANSEANMPITTGIFSNDANFDDRLVSDLGQLEELVQHLKGIKLRVVLTSGSFDLVHLGHLKYLAEAKRLGDVLIVGVDSDAKIRSRKGPDRPMVPQDERLGMLAFQRPVDVIVLKEEDHAKWALIRAVAPDVLVLTEDHNYSDAQLEELGSICGKVTVLPRQSVVTTSERIRQMYMNLGEKLGPELAKILPGLIEKIARGRRHD